MPIIAIPIVISDGLCQKLRSLRDSQLEKYGYLELKEIDGVHLWGTIGADVYLTFDGRFVLSEDSVVRGQSIRETFEVGYIGHGLTTAAFAFDLPELLDYLPKKPPDEPLCPYCQGARQVVYATGGHPPKQTCPVCCGLGWGKQMLD